MRVNFGTEGEHERPAPLLLLAALVAALAFAVAAGVPALAAEEPGGQGDEMVQPRVVGGESVPDGKYPFVTALLDVRYGETAYSR